MTHSRATTDGRSQGGRTHKGEDPEKTLGAGLAPPPPTV